MSDLRNQTNQAKDSISKDESSLRAVQRNILVRRSAIAALIAALDKAIKQSRKTDDRIK